MTRDSADIEKRQKWFDMFEPFDMHESRLKSLSSGMVANEDSCIERDTAEEVG